MRSRLIIDYVDIYEKKLSKKVIFADENRELTYIKFAEEAKSVAQFLIEMNLFKKPIAIYMDNSAECLAAFVGVMMSGNFYCPIDTDFSEESVSDVFQQLRPEVVIIDKKNMDKFEYLSSLCQCCTYDAMIEADIDAEMIGRARKEIVETDLAYILFTSGSTGKPKGVAVSHRSLLSYSEWVMQTMGFSERTVFGSQHPFLFSASITDIYGTIISGAQMWIIPRRLYKVPVELIKWTADKKINTIYMVPSALEMISRGNTFEVIKPTNITDVMFVGEAMPPNVLEKWIDNCNSKTRFTNLFGPTETVDICTYYRVPSNWINDGTPVPIGTSCENCDSFVVNDKLELAEIGEIGELYVRGPFLAYGYYNNLTKTNEAFVQNPLQNAYREIVYKTGDLASVDDNGIIHFHGRKDNQIKILGYRIELGQIESVVSTITGIDRVACIFDRKRKIILCFYKGDLDKDNIRKCIKDKLPRYMMPHKYFRVDEMPLNINGKIDRIKLKSMYV